MASSETAVRLFFRPLVGEPFGVDAQQSDTIGAVKQTIFAQRGLAPDSYRIVHAGKLVADSTTVEESGLAKGPAVRLLQASAATAASPELCYQIVVRDLLGHSWMLDVADSWPVARLRAELARLSARPQDTLRLVVGGRALADDCTVGDCSLRHERTTLIYVQPSSPPPLPEGSQTIFVQQLSPPGQLLLLVDPGDTIELVKRRIADKYPHIVPPFRLLFSGRMLEDHETVQACNLGRETTIHLIKRPT